MNHMNVNDDRRYVCKGEMHTVKEGDTLYKISRMHNVPLGELIEANRNMNIYDIQVGDRICVPEMDNDDMGPDNGMMPVTERDRWRVYIVEDEKTLDGVVIKPGSIVVIPE